jgi:dephospho-CoA kinase
MILIGIHGKARTGKTTSADYLLKKGAWCTSFAWRVYQTVQVMFNLKNHELHDDYKLIKHPKWGLTLREMLVLVGHDMARKLYSDNIWIQHVQDELDAVKKSGAAVKLFVVTDIRYQDEVDWLKEHDGILVMVERDVDNISNHITEKGIPRVYADYIIKNEDNIEDFYKKWDELLDILS